MFGGLELLTKGRSLHYPRHQCPKVKTEDKGGGGESGRCLCQHADRIEAAEEVASVNPWPRCLGEGGMWHAADTTRLTTHSAPTLTKRNLKRDSHVLLGLFGGTRKAATEIEKQKPAELTTMELLGDTELVQKMKEHRKTEALLKKEIERLNKQLCMSNQVWEKKFEILRQSFHAIKDEMFLRQTLQRQEAILHNASVSFAMDAPCSPQQKSPADDTVRRLYINSKVAPLPRRPIDAGGQQKRDRVVDIRLQSERGADALPGLDSLVTLADEEDEV
ncbi:unnamed protein product [Leuciscus chuanchicus]